MSFRSSDVAKRLVINAYRNQKEKELRDKFRKKGVLTKIVSANQKKSNVLVDILRESDSFNTMTSFSKSDQNATQATQQTNSNDDYLKKFRNTNVGRLEFFYLFMIYFKGYKSFNRLLSFQFSWK